MQNQIKLSPQSSNGKFILEVPDDLSIRTIQLFDASGKAIPFTSSNDHKSIQTKYKGVIFFKILNSKGFVCHLTTMAF